MSNPLDQIRRKLFPTAEEREIDGLMRDIQSFEVKGWCSHLIDYIAFESTDDEIVPDSTFEVWNSLSDFQKQRAFFYLLGAIKGLIQPPSEDGEPIVTV